MDLLGLSDETDPVAAAGVADACSGRQCGTVSTEPVAGGRCGIL